MMRLSFRPVLRGFSRLLGHKSDDVVAHAREQWEIAPGGSVHVRPALMLEGQMERIRGAEFATTAEVARAFQGGFEVPQPPTMGYVFRDASLLDGVLYAGTATRHLRPRAGRRPMGMVHHAPGRAAMYESWTGNRWFGNWLSDDCLTYRLAEHAGVPTASLPAKGHQPEYERKLGMSARRAVAVIFDELVVFDDMPHNDNKRDRADDMRRRLVGPDPQGHRGVFLLRGATGDRRMLGNEQAVADHLATRHGFRVLDPSNAPLDDIIDACAGAEVVAGVEGSHLVHGLVMMPARSRALVIQPPARAVAALKLLTDRQGQDYSMVVGMGGDDVFHADIEEIDRTLDLA